MNDEQRGTYMKDVVKPKMADLFAAYDPKKYEKVMCTTCHGPGAKEGKFKMPNPALPKFADFAAAKKLDAKMTDFMAAKVLPEMAKLLGETPFDPATKSGFGCRRCHTNP